MPMCWYCPPEKFAMNSSEAPAPTANGSGSMRTPSTVTSPPDTVGVLIGPSNGQSYEAQPGGSVLPEKSTSIEAASATSPSATVVITVPLSVPAPKSAAVWSCAHTDGAAAGVVKLAGAAGGCGLVAELLAASADVTR